MSSRRGRSRGQTGREASSSKTDSLTFCSDFSMDRYPSIRSGWARGRGLHNLAASSFNFVTNSARFQFPCTHGNFSFMASCLPWACGGQIWHPLDELLAEQGLRLGQMHGIQDHEGSGGPECPARWWLCMPRGVATPQDEEDCNYGCRIIEEQPNTSHDV